MDFNSNPTVSEAHPETMDFLSRAWCNFAVQTFQPDLQDGSLVLQENPIKNLEAADTKSPFLKMEDADRPMPSWKSNDVKSWIWMQQAMHPELNYNSCFRKKWRKETSVDRKSHLKMLRFSWKMFPLRHVSIKKWLKEIKQKRKDDQRLQRAEVHAAISVAGVATALAAIAAEGSGIDALRTTKDTAVASAAALVAAQCAQVAEAMGAKREQLSTVLSSAMSGTTANDILTLTAAAATSIKGAATLKARSSGIKNRINGNAPVLPIEEKNDFENCRSILGKGAELNIETSDGKRMLRSVSIILTNEAKVIIKIRKLNLLSAFASTKQSIVLDLHAELYKNSDGDDETNTCYLIVLTTNQGMIKLDMKDDYQGYQMWATTINHMLMLSTSFTKYELQFYKS